MTGPDGRLGASIDVFSGSQTTTMMLCPNLGQGVNYPGQVSELCHWRQRSNEE